MLLMVFDSTPVFYPIIWISQKMTQKRIIRERTEHSSNAFRIHPTSTTTNKQQQQQQQQRKTKIGKTKYRIQNTSVTLVRVNKLLTNCNPIPRDAPVTTKIASGS
jgi:hypothetical protein